MSVQFNGLWFARNPETQVVSYKYLLLYLIHVLQKITYIVYGLLKIFSLLYVTVART